MTQGRQKNSAGWMALQGRAAKAVLIELPKMVCARVAACAPGMTYTASAAAAR